MKSAELKIPQSLRLDEAARTSVWETAGKIIEEYEYSVERLPVSPRLDVENVRRFVESFTFEKPLDAVPLLRGLAPELQKSQVHTPHPRYFGLFNPAPSTMSIAADALVAAFNPQLAAWSHSPLAVEIERHLVRSIGEKFYFGRERVDGTFTTGGAEANLTALLAALNHRWPEIATVGLRGLMEEPVFYVSAEGHHSFLKAVRSAGLGANALREARVTPDLKLDIQELRKSIRQDRAAGFSPFLLIGTAGTTGAGAVDPLPEMADLAREEKMWLHIDAAWGGAAVLSPKLAPLLEGIELADSITFDAHKWLSVSMGAGIFLTSHPDILGRTFAAETAYMPKEGRGLATVDPFVHSIQWSRRFIGLKVFLSLAVAGWQGYTAAIEHQTAMADLLRKRLAEEGWHILNRTPLPVVCFTDGGRELDVDGCQRIAGAVINSGEAWISTIQMGAQKQSALRACITNHKTQPEHVESLVAILNRSRARNDLGEGTT